MDPLNEQPTLIFDSTYYAVKHETTIHKNYGWYYGDDEFKHMLYTLYIEEDLYNWLRNKDYNAEVVLKKYIDPNYELLTSGEELHVSNVLIEMDEEHITEYYLRF